MVFTNHCGALLFDPREGVSETILSCGLWSIFS